MSSGEAEKALKFAPVFHEEGRRPSAIMTAHWVRNHSHWGAFFAKVEDGRVVGVRPFERDPDPSALIEAIPASVHSPTRISAPMVREGWPGAGTGAGRGRERFVPVSWERALDLVAKEIRRVRASHGNTAIMGGSQGWGSAGIFHAARGQLHRFLGACGGFVDQTSNYSFGSALTSSRMLSARLRRSRGH